MIHRKCERESWHQSGFHGLHIVSLHAAYLDRVIGREGLRTFRCREKRPRWVKCCFSDLGFSTFFSIPCFVVGQLTCLSYTC